MLLCITYIKQTIDLVLSLPQFMYNKKTFSLEKSKIYAKRKIRLIFFILIVLVLLTVFIEIFYQLRLLLYIWLLDLR